MSGRTKSRHCHHAAPGTPNVTSSPTRARRPRTRKSRHARGGDQPGPAALAVSLDHQHSLDKSFWLCPPLGSDVGGGSSSSSSRRVHLALIVELATLPDVAFAAMACLRGLATLVQQWGHEVFARTAEPPPSSDTSANSPWRMTIINRVTKRPIFVNHYCQSIFGAFKETLSTRTRCISQAAFPPPEGSVQVSSTWISCSILPRRSSEALFRNI